jgi:hypothetical protein
MKSIIYTNLSIIDRLRSSPQNTATLNHAIGGGLPHHSGDAYLGLGIFNLVRLRIVDLIDENGNTRAREILEEASSETRGLHLGYAIARNFITKYGDSWQVKLTGRIFDLQEMLGFSITGLMAGNNRMFTFDAGPIFREPNPHLVADVFVLTPFQESFRPVFDDNIKPVCAKLGYTVRRADDILMAGDIIEDIWSLIYNSKIVIADCTSKNPNVFYEIGISDTIGKKLVLITQNKDDVPFDIRHRRYIEYKFTPRGIAKFESTLEKYLTAKAWTYSDNRGMTPSGGFEDDA